MENNETNKPASSGKQQSATVASRNSGVQCKKIAIWKAIIFQLVFFIIPIKIPSFARVLNSRISSLNVFLSLFLFLARARKKYRYAYMRIIYYIYFYYFLLLYLFLLSFLCSFLLFSCMTSFNISDTDAFVSLL